MDKLALCGGNKIIKSNIKRFNSMGKEEANAAKKVVMSGILSNYLAEWGDDFYGGPNVVKFESMWSKYFNVKHAITVNSWTSGLICAVGALDIEPGDEIIVPTWTMAATATSIIVWNAIPVFADIDPQTFNISLKSIEQNITPYTKAIISVDIFGQSADMISIMELAKKHNLKVISDSAQSPGAYYDGKYAGTIADIGGYSLNYHKHIHTGEGGVLVTNDDDLAERMQLIRNHAEAVVKDKGHIGINNMIGFNFRLGEIESAIGIEQLKKLKHFVNQKKSWANILNEGLSNLDGLSIPCVHNKCDHVYYSYPLIINENKLGVSRDTIINALKSEGVPALANKYENIHLYPMYQKKIAYGKKGFPWNNNVYKGNVKYDKGICPVAEEYNNNKFINFGLSLIDLNEDLCFQIVKSFKKVWDNIDVLKKL